MKNEKKKKNCTRISFKNNRHWDSWFKNLPVEIGMIGGANDEQSSFISEFEK